MYNCLLFFLLCLLGCEIINPEETIPSYIEINQFNLNTNYDQGTNSNKIEDVWVFIDDNLQGIYELPAILPVLKEGKHKIELKAGIKKNGISASRCYYPFYTSYVDSIEIKYDSIVEINPNITYNIQNIPFIEDFENSGIKIINSGESDTSIIVKNDTHSFEGKYGLAELNENQNIFECSTYDNFVFSNSQNIYLEMDYKSNVTFVVGIYITTPFEIIQEPFLYINPKENWNKIYVDLSQKIASYSNAVSFNIWIGFGNNSEENKRIMIDNVKVVYNE